MSNNPFIIKIVLEYKYTFKFKISNILLKFAYNYKKFFMEEKIQNIDKRLTMLENMHKVAIPIILGIGVLYLLSKK